VNSCCKLLVLVLLVKPISGLGQQQPAAKFESLVATAQQAQAVKDYVSAANAYKQAVKIQPAMPELWANLGLMEQEAGDIPAAILSFQQANRLKPSLYVPDLFLGIDFQRTGRAAAAIPFLIKAEKINQTDPQTPLALGRAYFATGKFSSAALEFAHAATLDPKLGEAWFALGLARLNQVEVDARRMSVEAKDSAFAGALYAESLEKQARFSEASTLYRSLLTTQPQPPCIRSELGFSLLRHRDLAGAGTEFAAEQAVHPECGLALLGQARMAIDNGDNERAVQLINGLWGRDHGFVASNASILLESLPIDAATNITRYFSKPNTFMAADLRNTLLLVLSGSAVDLIDQRDESRRREPAADLAREPLSAWHTAEQYYAAGEFEKCAKQIDPVRTAGRVGIIRLLAACSFFTGDDERAIAAATALETVQPHSPEALYWSIQANERLAFKALAHFQQLESDSARSHVLLGDIYDQLERFDDAQSEYTKALSIAPGDPGAMVGLASAYLSNNNNEKAMETARIGLERNTQDPELNLIMAETLVAKYQYAEAEPYLMKSLNAKPQMLGHVHALIGKVYAETGRPQEAIDQLKLGVTSDENGSVHYLLARLYRQIGDIKNASAALDQVKTIKQLRRDRGVKTVEDPDLSSLESPPDSASKP
jgi:tetratricopeptide (TPR) repeat protein